jgi:hypothetical protein
MGACLAGASIDDLHGRRSQIVVVDGFYKAIGDAVFHGLNRGGHISAIGESQERRAWPAGLPAPHKLEAVDARGLQVADHQAYGVIGVCQRIVHGLGRDDVELVAKSLENGFAIGWIASCYEYQVIGKHGTSSVHE